METNPYLQIDFVFIFLKERSELSAAYGKENIWNHIKATPEKGINRQMFEEILQRLLDDKYIRETITPDTQSTFHLTFNGRLFSGYADEFQLLNEAKMRINKMQDDNLRISRKVKVLTLWLAIGTSLAAIYYVLEVLNHWICIYPRK